MATGSFRLPISAGGTVPTPPVGQWTKPADWPDISNVANNEINLLVSDAGLATVAFKVDVVGGSTVDYGDGTVTNYASGALAQHTYTVGTGTPCSRGYTTFKIRIYAQNSANAIRRFYVQPHSGITAVTSQTLPILWAVMGTTGLTSLQAVLYQNSPNVSLPDVEQIVLPPTLNSCSDLTYYPLHNTGAFSVVFPPLLNTPTDGNFALVSGSRLRYLTLPEQMNNLTIANNWVRADCAESITLPNLPKVSSCSTVVSGLNVRQILNTENFGISATSVTCTGPWMNCELVTSLSFNCKFSKFLCAGTSSVPLKLNSLRLLNPNSLFVATSPQISINYCSLDAAALNTLFGDLPTLTGKTISITGNPGAATCDRTIATAKGWTVTG